MVAGRDDVIRHDGFDAHSALKRVLSDEVGLSGQSENYYHPRNCQSAVLFGVDMVCLFSYRVFG